MGLYKRDFTGMTGYIKRLKEEADQREIEQQRRVQEEAAREQAAQWRREAPIGPPTQAQAFSLPQPQKPKPKLEVGHTNALADTSTPALGQSSLPSMGQTLAAPALPPLPEPTPSALVEAPPQSALDQWNLPKPAPRNAAVAQPAAPAFLSGILKPSYDQFGNAMQDWQQYLPQAADAVGKFAEQWGLPDAFNIGAQLANPDSPERLVVDLKKESIETRAKERQGRALDQGFVRQTLGHLGTAASNLIDLLSIPVQLQAVQKQPGTNQTYGQQWGKVLDVERMLQGGDPADPTDFTRDDSPMTGEQPWFGGLSEAARGWGIVDPVVWSNLPNVTEYWDMANKNLIQSYVLTPAQDKASSKKQKTLAKNLAIVMNYQGTPVSANVLDATLNYPIEAANLLSQSDAINKQADALWQDPERQLALRQEAGRLTAQAAKLREVTPLQLYNEHADNWNAFWYEMAFDPFNAVDVGTDLFKLGVAARRFQQGTVMAEAAASVAPGFNRRLVDNFKDNPIVEWMKLNYSKGQTDAKVNFGVLTNLLSFASTKGDIATVLTRYINGTLAEGIPLAQLTSPEAALRAADGIVQFGQAGINDWRAIKAHKSLQGLQTWITSLPSLQGPIDEIADRTEVMGDLLGMLTRAGMQRYGVAKLGGVPWGAQSFQVAQTAGNKAVVQFIDAGKQVIGQSAEMTLSNARKAVKQFETSLAKGAEAKTNYVKAVGDFRRNLLSTYTINNPGGIVTNAVGGTLTGLMDRGFSFEYFKPLAEQVEYIRSKFGGFIPEARHAEGVAEVKPRAGVHYGAQAAHTGFTGKLGNILNWTTLGVAGVSRKVRQGAAQIPGTGIKVGEEAIAFGIYTAAFKEFVERELPRLVTPQVKAVLERAGINSPDTVRYITDQVVQSGLSGGTVDVARTFQDIANGKIGISLRTLSPAFSSLFSHDQVLEIDGLLRHLRPETLAVTRQRIGELLNLQRGRVEMEMMGQVTEAGRHFYTEQTDLRDVTDMVDVLQNAAQMTGRSVDEALQRGRSLGEAQQQLNEGILQLLQMVQHQPQYAHYVYGVWGRINAFRSSVRANIASQAEIIAQESKAIQSRIMQMPVFKDQRPSVRDIIGNPQGPSVPRGGAVRGDIAVMSPSSLGLPGNQLQIPRNNRLPEGFSTLMPPYLLQSLKQVFVLGDEAVQGVAQVLDSRAKVWAKYSKRPAQEWYTTYIRSIQRTPNSGRHGLASVQVFKNQTDVVLRASNRLMQQPGSTEKDRLAVLAHEIGHIFNHDMDILAKDVPEVAEQWAEAKRYFHIPDGSGYLNDGRPYEAEPIEEFANAFAQYLFGGKAPTRGLQGVFRLFHEWLNDILNSVRSLLSLDLNQVRGKRAFDYILGDKPIKKVERPQRFVPEAEDEILGRNEAMGHPWGDPPEGWVADPGELYRPDTQRKSEFVPKYEDDSSIAFFRPEGLPYPASTADVDTVSTRWTAGREASPHQQPPALGKGQVSPHATYPRPTTAQPTPPAAPRPQKRQVTPEEVDLWAEYYQWVDAQWADFARESMRFLEEARDMFLTNRVQPALLEGRLPDFPSLMGGEDFSKIDFTAKELLSDLAVDPAQARAFVKEKLGFYKDDPLFQPAIDSYRKLADKYQAELFVSLARYPNMVSFDEFMSALYDVKQFRRQTLGQIRGAQAAIDAAKAAGEDVGKLVGQKKAIENNAWPLYWRRTWDRLQAGAQRIQELNIRMQQMEMLEFEIPGVPGQWKLRGPNLRNPKQWQAVSPDGRVRNFESTDLIPTGILDRYKEIQAMAKIELNEQIGRIGADARVAGAGAGEVDALLQQAGKGTPEMIAQIRRGVQQYMANYEHPHNLPQDLPRYWNEQLDAAEVALSHALQEVAVANSQGYGRMGLGVISDFNKNVLPVVDNIFTGGQRYGNEMTSVSVVDYTNNYHPDTLLGLYAPYHYWFTRQGKNVLERMIFHPFIHTNLARFFRMSEEENRADNMPARNISTFPGAEVQAGDNTFRTQATLLARWIPTLSQYYMHGWANPNRANRAFEYALEKATEEAWPATAGKLTSNLIYGNELAKQFGLSPYPDIELLAQYMAGEDISAQGSLGEMSSLHRVLGWAAVNFALWAEEQGIPLVPQVMEGYADLAVPDYKDYLYGREASFETARGNLPTDLAGGFVQDVARQERTGETPLPEQALLAPQAGGQYNQVRGNVAVEYFIRNLISWASGVPVAAIYGPEAELRQAQEDKRNMAYDPTTGQGSQAAYFSSTDPDSPNHVPGLQTFNNQYAVMGEQGFGDEGPVERPVMDALRQEYHSRRQEVFAKYEAEQQAAYEQHPEWQTRQGLDAKSDFDKAFYDRREAELKAIDDQFPTITGEEKKGPTPWSLYGARPAETEQAAQRRLLTLAEANVAHLKPPDEGDVPPAQWERYYAAREAELTRLMNDPQAASDVVFNRALPMQGEKQPGPTADILRGGDSQGARITEFAQTRTETRTPLAQQVAPDPANQWAAEMAAAEQEYGLPAGLLQAVARHESNFNPEASSGAAHGLMQFTPSTWAGLPASLGATDIWDPEQSITAAAFYLNQINGMLPADRKNDVAWMVAAYNVGIGNVQKMQSLEDIKDPNIIPWADRNARYNYALNIASEVAGATQDVVPGALQTTIPSGETYTNPNWGSQVGKWTVVGDPITDTGLTWVWPFGEGDSKQVYQHYGETHVDGLGAYYASKNQGFGHEGIDFMRPEGTPVLAIAEGKVIFVGDGKNDGRPAYGNMVVVEHPNGMKSRYGHLKDFDVQVGDVVIAGQVVGGVGDTPKSANIGYHLHLSVESPDEQTGPYRTIDPFRLIGHGGSTAPVQPVLQPPVQAPVSRGTQAAVSPPAQGEGVAWTRNPSQVLEQDRYGNMAPAKAEAEKAVAQEFEAIETSARASYPKHAHLWDEYRELYDTEKEAWRQANPMMRALNLAGYNPKEWAYVEKTFGKGSVEKWALLPPSVEAGGEEGARGAYYRQYPDVFLAKAWIDGRPQPYSEEGFDPEKPFVRDFGSDYEKAKELFGDDIWATVRKYYTVPQYIRGGDNTAWIAFKEEHPEFDQWRVWWYELMGGEATTSTFTPFQRGNFSFSGGDGFGSTSGHGKSQVNPVRFEAGKPPAFAGGSNVGGDWRKYLALGETALKNWRR